MKKSTLIKRARLASLINLITQSGIIVTGAVVRLTGSGLGCPTWPNCAPGSLVPVASQVEGFHKYIEFGNRLLTFVVLLASVAVLVVALISKNRRIIIWSTLPLIGTLLQAILGGITVLTGLNPFTVMFHFLLSIVLVAISVIIYKFWAKTKPTKITSKLIRNYLKFFTGVGFVVITLGTITTGSGPHSGDEIAARFEIDTRTIAWIHADSVLLFIGLLIGLILLVRTNKEYKSLTKYLNTLFAFCVIQGFIGYTQWFTNLPWILVGFHVLGSVLIWINLMFIFEKSIYSLKDRIKQI
ncbi:MAG: COX15/CtaA family protein [Actinomycetes bacterium]